MEYEEEQEEIVVEYDDDEEEEVEEEVEYYDEEEIMVEDVVEEEEEEEEESYDEEEVVMETSSFRPAPVVAPTSPAPVAISPEPTPSLGAAAAAKSISLDVNLAPSITQNEGDNGALSEKDKRDPSVTGDVKEKQQPQPIPQPEVTGPTDPPGWAVPVQHMEWWAHQKELREQEKWERKKARKHRPFKAEAIAEERRKHQPPPPPHRLKEYMDGRSAKRMLATDDDFAWMPPPDTRLQRSPDGRAATFRTREAQNIYETAVPKRSWSIDEDDDTTTKGGEGETVVSFSQSSWMFPMMTNQPKKDEDNGRGVVQEEFVKDDGQEILEKVVKDDDDDDDGDGDGEKEVVAEDQKEGVSNSSSTSSPTWGNPNVTDETKNRAPTSLASSSSSTTPSSKGSSSSSESIPTENIWEDRKKKKKKRHRNSTEKMESSMETVEESSASARTHVIYIQDDGDQALERVLRNCLDGDGLLYMEDDFQVLEQPDGYFVPSPGVLAILILLILLVAAAISIGLYFYFSGGKYHHKIRRIL